ncbi:synergin gamma-like [Anguilla anguilla]|uniref:synergin gamma-like n=1 Tax=Anguilla anguilla TaxID=7936 RepID=UPI0015B031F7|nr:synergin gamma-like [Anguilla anguilla]
MALRPGPGGAGSFIYPVGGGLGPPQGLMPVQGPQPQQGFPMMQVMSPNMQGMMGINFGAQMTPAAMPMQGGLTMGIQAPGMQFVGQPQFISVRATGPQYTHIAEEHQKRLEQQQKLLEEDRKRRQFEEQKQKLRLLSSVKPKAGEKSRDDALEAIKGNLDGFSRDAKLHPTPSSHPKKAGVGVYPQQDHIQPLMPAWLYNDSLVPELFKKVLDFTLTPAGIDTAKLYPILMSSGLPREALGQIWASANRTTPGKLTKEELYAVLAMIGVTQSGIPAIGLDILSQFPSPPMPNLPAMTAPPVLPQHQQPIMSQTSVSMATPPVLPQHQQPIMSQTAVPMTTPPVLPQHQLPIMSQTPVSMATPPVLPQHQQPIMSQTSVSTPTPTPAVIGMSSSTSIQPANSFVACFPPLQGTKPDDDDFQDFQEAPKAGASEDPFTDFQAEPGNTFSSTAHPQQQTSVTAILTPVSRSSSLDKYAAFKQLSVEQAADTSSPASDFTDKYSVFRQLEQPGDRKSGEGFSDFKSASTDDGFTDFKTADAVSPSDPSDQTKTFHPSFPPPFALSQPLHQQPQNPPSRSRCRNPLNMADLDLFAPTAPPAPAADPKNLPFPSTPQSAEPRPEGAVPLGKAGDDFGEFALFGSSTPNSCSAATPGCTVGVGGTALDEFADFLAFRRPGEISADANPVLSGSRMGEALPRQQQQHVSDKYNIFKQLSLEGSLGYDTKDSGGCAASLKSDIDDFAEFQSSKFCTALGASEKSLLDKVTSFKQSKEDSASVKSLDLPSTGGSSAGKEDSEDTLSVQLDMKLSDMGGDLKHVMSDSSLDLPAMSAHQPPASGEELVRLLW